MNKVDFINIIGGLAANFGVKVPAGLIDLWINAFQKDGISINQIRKAAGVIIRTKTNAYGRMPTYAEFIELIKGKHENKAQIAANEIITHLNSKGSGVPLKLEDTIAMHLMSTRWPYGQWASTVLEKEITWWIKDFCDAYNAFNAKNEMLRLEDGVENKKLKELISCINND